MAGGCGHAVIRPPAATVGALARIEADNGYFGLMKAWVPGCPVPSIAFHPVPYGPIGSELPGPNGLYSGVRATLAISDASVATFLVPSIPVGTYRTALSCGSADEAFAQPELPDDFRVLP